MVRWLQISRLEGVILWVLGIGLFILPGILLGSWPATVVAGLAGLYCCSMLHDTISRHGLDKRMFWLSIWGSLAVFLVLGFRFGFSVSVGMYSLLIGLFFMYISLGTQELRIWKSVSFTKWYLFAGIACFIVGPIGQSLWILWGAD